MAVSPLDIFFHSSPGTLICNAPKVTLMCSTFSVENLYWPGRMMPVVKDSPSNSAPRLLTFPSRYSLTLIIPLTFLLANYFPSPLTRNFHFPIMILGNQVMISGKTMHKTKPVLCKITNGQTDL